MKHSNMISSLIILISPMMAMSSSSWIMLWILLEISSMSFIMMIITKKNNWSKESSMKYFLIQSAASTILLITFLSKETNMNMKMALMIPSMLISLALATKLAAAPMHTWLPNLTNKISWNNLAVMLTWQKLAPLFMMMKNNPWKMIFTLATISMLMGVMSQFNLTSTKIILSMSSVAHMGWIFMAMLSNNNIPMMYLFIYSFISITIMMNFKKNNTKTLSQQMSKKNKIYMSILMMSLAGIPPLMGFIPKWMVLSNTEQKMKSILLLTSMVILASIGFFIYIRMVISPMVNQAPNSTLKMNKTNNNSTPFLINTMMPIMMISYPK